MNDPSGRAVLVTGATGFVGRHLCVRLRDAGWSVRAVLRGGEPGRRAGIDYRLGGNIGAPFDWTGLLDGVDVVVHAAARVHVPRETRAVRQGFWAVNVEGSRRLAEQAAAAGVGRLVALSSLTAIQASAPGATLYHKSKRRAEEVLQETAARHGLELAILRPPLVYAPDAPGNFRRLVGAVRRGLPLPLAGIHNRRSFLYLENLLDVLELAMTHPNAPGHVFALGDGPALSTPAFARLIGEALGRPARLWPCPAWALSLAGAVTGRTPNVRSLTDSLTADNRPISAILGWQPRFDTRQGLAATLTPATGTAA